MRRTIPVLLAILFLAPAVFAGQYGTRAMSGWFNVRTNEGWTGRRYMDGTETIAEEFDSNRDDSIDVWRFYRRGILSSEERDMNFDGKVDYVSHYDSNTGFLTSAMRDTHFRGVNDVEIEYKGRNRWEVREDRNNDGITDRIIYADAPHDLYSVQTTDMATQVDVAATVPMETWTEVWADDGFSGYITDYFRYNRGVLTQHGAFDGRRVQWARVPPDYIPPSPTPATPDPLKGMDQYVRRDPDAFVPPPGPPPVRDPFNMNADGYDPYAGMGPRSQTSSPVWSGQTAPGPDYPPPDIRSGIGPSASPQYESSARAVPARMRAPGQTAAPERRGNRR